MHACKEGSGGHLQSSAQQRRQKGDGMNSDIARMLDRESDVWTLRLETLRQALAVQRQVLLAGFRLIQNQSSCE